MYKIPPVYEVFDQLKVANAWMKYAMAYSQMSMAAGEVIIHRSVRISQGTMTGPEAIGMVMEKATAFAAATEGAAVAAANGGHPAKIATAALHPISAKTSPTSASTAAEPSAPAGAGRMTTVVRPLGFADEAAWRGLWRGYLAFYETSLPAAVYASSFARLVDPEVRDYQGLLAVADGTPIGLAHYIFHRHGWQIADVCYLQDLYVVPEARGGGAGRALIAAVYAAADAAGAPNVYWLTQEFNATARRLYDQVGSVTPFIKYRR